MTVANSRDLTRAVTEINEHADQYRLADRMYRNEVDEVFASPKIRAMLQELGKHYRTNIAAVPVDAVFDALEISSVMVPAADGETPDNKLTQILMEKVWEANQLDLYLPDWLKEVGKEGDAYLVVWGGEEDGTCEIHMRRPVGARMFYSEENERVKSFFAYKWSEGGTVRVNLMYPDRVEKYVSKSKDPKSANDFTQYSDESDGDTWPLTHEYTELPAFHGRTEHPYGVPDHYNAFGPQNILTKALAVGLSALDFQGFPQRAALMDQPIEDDGDAWDADDEEDDPPEGGIRGVGRDDDSVSQMKSSPGRVWMLRNVKQLMQLEAADPEGFTKWVDKAVQLASAATGTPIRFYNGTQGQAPSGASLAEDDKRLNKRIMRRILMAGAVLQDALTFAMRDVLGYTDCPTVVVTWAPVRRAEYADQWETVQAKQEAGVPRDVTLQEAGYTNTQVTAWKDDAPDPGNGLAARVELMERLAGAAEKLASAAELGALDMSVVQSLMAGFLPDDPEGD